MDDLLTQHEDPTGDAGRSAASYVTAALTAAHTAVQWRTRRIAPPGEDQTATGDADRAAYAAVLGPDQGRTADTDTALRAWTAAQPLRTHSEQAEQVAQRAEARLRTLHPDAMDRYASLRQHLDPVQAMREVTPLIRQPGDSHHNQPAGHQPPQPERLTPGDMAEVGTGGTAAAGPTRARNGGQDQDHLRARETVTLTPGVLEPLVTADTATAYSNSQATAGPREQAPPQVRLQPVVREVLHTELATAVLRDQAWPALAVALEQAQQLGAEAAELLREVAEQRELRTAKHPAQVLTHRLQQRSPTAADVVASSYPTAQTDAPLVRPSDHSGTDLTVLAAALELSRETDAERHTGGTAVSTLGDLAIPWVDNQTTDGGITHADQRAAAAANSSATLQLGQAGSATSEPAPLATASAATSTAARSYPVDLRQVPNAHKQQAAGRPAPTASTTRSTVTAPTRRR